MKARFILLTALSLCAGRGLGQEPINPPPPSRPALSLQVLESLSVRRGRDMTIYQRVVPPVLPPRRAAPAPLAETPVTRPLTLAQQRRAAKNSAVLFLSATVYDHRVTELRWFENQREYRAFSNADFNLLAGCGEIETEDTIYWLIMGLGNLSRQTAAQVDALAAPEVPPSLWQIPVPENFSAKRAEYVLAEGSMTPLPSAETLAAFDALHIFYDANKAALVEEQARQAVENAARAEAQRVKAATPKRTVIQFWPMPKAAKVPQR